MIRLIVESLEIRSTEQAKNAVIVFTVLFFVCLAAAIPLLLSLSFDPFLFWIALIISLIAILCSLLGALSCLFVWRRWHFFSS